MSVSGIGNDIVQVERIKQIISKDSKSSFKNKVFHQREQEYCEKSVNCYERYAARFAVKESLIKALDCKNLPLNEIIVEKTQSGKPVIKIKDELIRKFNLGHLIIHCSMSHEKDYATAYVVVENTGHDLT